MSVNNTWLLPDGIEELLPREAERLEQFRRQYIDLFQRWGYELVIPPLMEYLDSLLVGAGSDLEASTFKVVDPMSGRMMGVPADITPQVARIDVHRLKQQGQLRRLCYFGPVLLTKARELGGSRSPYQLGAELYGYAGIAADLEIINLMLESLAVHRLDSLHLDLGHVSIFRQLIHQAKISSSLENKLFDALQRKANSEIDVLLDGLPAAPAIEMLRELAALNGGAEVIQNARQIFGKKDPIINHCLDDLQKTVEAVQDKWPKLPLHIDLAELRGYQYHTGLVFSAYVAGYPQAISRGGRYDGIGRAFGSERAATGFSIDISVLLSLLDDECSKQRLAILAPVVGEPALENLVNELRAKGETVICELPGQDLSTLNERCNRIIKKRGSVWALETLK